jgi:hypothetical protein
MRASKKSVGEKQGTSPVDAKLNRFVIALYRHSRLVNPEGIALWQLSEGSGDSDNFSHHLRVVAVP